MPESRPPLDIAGRSLDDIARALGDRRLPPVAQWDPPHCGHSGMRIAADGGWLHHGSPIHRPEMVRLFATLLRRERDGRHVLVTPIEKLDIDVDLAALTATAMQSEGSGRARRIALQLNRGDALLLGPDRPLRLADGEHGPVPLAAAGGGLEALLSRPVYYELAELALAEGHDPPGLWSAGAFFALDPGR